MEKEIRAFFIFEMLGKPAEHLKKTMEELINKLGEIPGIAINNKKVHEPKPFEKEPSFFTTFSEVELTAKNINDLINLVFHSMPSHIEIIEPEELSLKNSEMSSLLSNLTVKLHRYDEIAKEIIMERNILINKLKELENSGLKNKKSKKRKTKTKKKNTKKASNLS